MIIQLLESEKNVVCGGWKFDRKIAFTFGTILLGGTTALQSFFRESFKKGIKKL